MLNVSLCIWYHFEQISAWVFLIHLFFYVSIYCTKYSIAESTPT